MFDINLTSHLAELSKLDFSETELEKMSEQMSDIVALMDKVKEIDPSEATYAADAVKYKDLRSDNPKESFPTEDILKNSKVTENNSFVVPKVV